MPLARCRAALTSALGLSAAVALLASVIACGSVHPASSPTLTPAPGSSSPSDKVFNFSLNPAASDVVARGTVTVSAGEKTTTVELRITGLQANSSHVSHIHVGSCQQRGGIAFALNQVIADGQGVADTRTTLDIAYPPRSGRWYVVVHSGPDMQGSSALYLLCGNLFS